MPCSTTSVFSVLQSGSQHNSPPYVIVHIVRCDRYNVKMQFSPVFTRKAVKSTCQGTLHVNAVIVLTSYPSTSLATTNSFCSSSTSHWKKKPHLHAICALLSTIFDLMLAKCGKFVNFRCTSRFVLDNKRGSLFPWCTLKWNDRIV